MPKNKDLKRVVRTRMTKTGESYTAARSQVLNRKRRRAHPPSSRGASSGGTDAAPKTRVADYPAVAGMSDDAVSKKTGRTWKQWVDVLDRAGAASLPHREIAALLHERHGVAAWWAQMVTVGYERIHGLRVRGQRRDGSFDVNKSKTIGVPVSRLYGAFSSKQVRERWLPGATVKTSQRDKSVRLLHADGSPIEAYFAARGEDKSQVQVQHRKLATADDAAAAKADWTERLAALTAILTGTD